MIFVETQGVAMVEGHEKQVGTVYADPEAAPWGNWNAVHGEGVVWAWEVWRHSTRVAYGSVRGVERIHPAIMAACRIFLEMG